MFSDGFQERYDLEQYFWTEKTVNDIMKALDHNYNSSCICLTTPSLAHGFWIKEQRIETLLDIDKRFSYLPKYYHFDILNPKITLLPEEDKVDIIIIDPPFFYILMIKIYESVLYICKNDIKNVKILIAFLVREEKILLETFKEFNLKKNKTKFRICYCKI